jgi:2-methylcitrate dehydratase PrpD
VVIHPLIDACLELVRNRDIRSEDMRAITAAVHPRAIELAGRRHPETAITGRFSLHHAAALALTRRSAALAAFDADVNEPELVALRELMVIEVDAGLRPGQARVELKLADGTRLEHAVDHPSGSPERPLTDMALRAKFVELATRAIDSRSAGSLFEICMALERIKDVAELRRRWIAPLDSIKSERRNT